LLSPPSHTNLFIESKRRPHALLKYVYNEFYVGGGAHGKM